MYDDCCSASLVGILPPLTKPLQSTTKMTRLSFFGMRRITLPLISHLYSSDHSRIVGTLISAVPELPCLPVCSNHAPSVGGFACGPPLQCW